MTRLFSEKKGIYYDAVVVMQNTGEQFVQFKLEFPRKKAHRVDVALCAFTLSSVFAEQVGMGASTGKGQCENIFFHQINEQPIRLQVALPKALVISGKGVVTILSVKRPSVCQFANYKFKHLPVTSRLRAARSSFLNRLV